MDFPKLKNPTILSPMSGVTDIAFRTLCKRYGVGMTVTEFVSSAAVVRGNKDTFELLRVDKSEKPVCVQLFGANEKEVVEAGILLQDKFDIIDVNCGCPAFKVIKTGAGSEMLKEPAKIERFVNKLVSSVSKPVTVKIRTGIDANHINALDIARRVENAGAAAITVHGRTQKQGYAGVADWDIIKKVKEAINIPVIGNGDVFSPEDYKAKMDYSGVDMIMIARGAMTNPYIFSQINEYMKTGHYTDKSKKEQFFEYLKLAEQNKVGFFSIKGHAMSLSKGLVGGSELRTNVSAAKNLSRIRELFEKL